MTRPALTAAALLLASTATVAHATDATGLQGGYMFFSSGPPGQQLLDQLVIGFEEKTFYFAPPLANIDPTGNGDSEAYDCFLSAPGVRVCRFWAGSTDYDYYDYEVWALNADQSFATMRRFGSFPADGQPHFEEFFIDTGPPNPQIYFWRDGQSYAYSESSDPGGGATPYQMNWIAGPLALFADPFSSSFLYYPPGRVFENTVVMETEIDKLDIFGFDSQSGWNNDGNQDCVHTYGLPALFVDNPSGSCGVFDWNWLPTVGFGFYDANW